MAKKLEVTDKDLKLLQAFKEIGGTSDIETKEDLINYIKHVGTGLSGVKAGSALPASSMTEHGVKFPRISLFYGESGKGEVNYLTWRYEIRCLIEEKVYTPEQILLGIRRSVKGQASDILRRMGTKVELDDILRKFETTYGDINTPECIMKKLYSCHQEPSESVVTYATRVEELFAEAIDLKAVEPAHENTILKNILYQGLSQPLRQMCHYKFDTVDNYDDFKVECRKLESELKDGSSNSKYEGKPQAQAMINKPEKSELSEVKDLLKQMNERIQKLELDKEQNIDSQRGGYSFRGRRHFRGRFSQSGQPRGRGTYQPTRPTGTHTFRPQGYRASPPPLRCYNCNKEGHIAKFCQENC